MRKFAQAFQSLRVKGRALGAHRSGRNSFARHKKLTDKSKFEILFLTFSFSTKRDKERRKSGKRQKKNGKEGKRMNFLKKEFALKRYNQLPYLDFNSNKQILKVNK